MNERQKLGAKTTLGWNTCAARVYSHYTNTELWQVLKLLYRHIYLLNIRHLKDRTKWNDNWSWRSDDSVKVSKCQVSKLQKLNSNNHTLPLFHLSPHFHSNDYIYMYNTCQPGLKWKRTICFKKEKKPAKNLPATKNHHQKTIEF